MLATVDAGVLEGHLVRIDGVGCPLEQYTADHALGLPNPTVEVDGECGICVSWDVLLLRYIVHLFSGVHVLVPHDCLTASEPPAAEDGGFDVAWPFSLPGEPIHPEHLSIIAPEIVSTVLRKGWCMIQLNADRGLQEEAFFQAKSIPDLASPKMEFIPDYLGREGTGKIAVLERDDVESWALLDFDQQLTYLAKALAPFTERDMSFKCRGRRKGVVWVPYASESDARRHPPEILTEDDVEAGVVESHLEFVRSRRLCLTSWIHCAGGEFELLPRSGSPGDFESVKLPFRSGKILVYACDLMRFVCKPATREALTLSTWILDDELDRQRLMGGSLSGGANGQSTALGIFAGPPVPQGHQTRIMAVHAHSPCNVHSIEEFQMIFNSGADGYVHIPTERFDTEIYCTEQGEERNYFKSYVVHSAMIDTNELIMFDNHFFGISDEEAKYVSPGQRVVLQDGYLTLHRAGFTKLTLRGRKMGAYCGDTGSEFQVWNQLPTAAGAAEEFIPGILPGQGQKPYGRIEASGVAQAGVMSIITANRLSHALGMKGTASSVDTACSASLVGVSLAVQHFRRADRQLSACADARVEDALCVGISCLLAPFAFIALCGPNMLALKGRCFTFNETATGYARGDGFSGCYLKPGDSDEDNINQVACLMGCSVNQDGRSATLTAPNGTAQQACIRSSLKEAEIRPQQLPLVECHGTGTALGDPIEVGALRGVMSSRDTPLFFTSAKSNIGHLECCAGLTGLLKCCLMVSNSASAANIHLSCINPHLDVEGFPALLQTEVTDTGQNSNYGGVSSFGFSGTNARADVWGRCRTGPHTASRVNPDNLQIYVQCPVTLGYMDFLTGENMTPSSNRRLTAHRADVLREDGARYDISRYAYEGEFRFRSRNANEFDATGDLNLFDRVYMCGTWTAFTQMDEMERQDDGGYIGCVVLGNFQFERFFLCINNNRNKEFYPMVNNASEKIWIEGADSKRSERGWIIDGRDHQVAIGTVYQVRFLSDVERKSIQWRKVTNTTVIPQHVPFKHQFALCGSFSSDRFSAMKSDGANCWAAFFRIGASGEEQFRIARDCDYGQLIYPAEHCAVNTAIPVRGPDDLAGEKAWLVRGNIGEVVKVALHIDDGQIEVQVHTDRRGTKKWKSKQGWMRHEYAILGSWTDDAPVTMVPVPEEGVYKAYGRIRTRGAEGFGESDGYAEAFTLVVDGDVSQTIYPQMDLADSTESIVLGPDGDGQGRRWVVRSQIPNVRFEVCYDPWTIDKRRTVTWSWMLPRSG